MKKSRLNAETLANLDATEAANTPNDNIPVAEHRRRIAQRAEMLRQAIEDNEALLAQVAALTTERDTFKAEIDTLRPRAEKAAEYELNEPLREIGVTSEAKRRAIVAEWKASGVADTVPLATWLKGDGTKNEVVTSLIPAPGGSGTANGGGVNTDKQTVTGGKSVVAQPIPPRANPTNGTGGDGGLSYDVINRMSADERVKRDSEINAWLDAQG